MKSKNPIIVAGIAALSLGAASQCVAQGISFVNFTLISGDDLKKDALYRFHDVASNVDALVKIDAISANSTLERLDDTSTPSSGDGYFEYFQPRFQGVATQNPFVDFTISFVEKDTSNAVSLGVKRITLLDIDGNNVGGDVYESVQVSNFNAYRLNSTSKVAADVLSLDPVSVKFTATNNGGPQGLSTDPDYAVELDYDNLLSLSVRFGMNGNFNSQQNRLYGFNMWDTPVTFTTPVTTPVPEPSGALLLGLGGIALLILRRRY